LDHDWFKMHYRWFGKVTFICSKMFEIFLWEAFSGFRSFRSKQRVAQDFFIFSTFFMIEKIFSNVCLFETKFNDLKDFRYHVWRRILTRRVIWWGNTAINRFCLSLQVITQLGKSVWKIKCFSQICKENRMHKQYCGLDCKTLIFYFISWTWLQKLIYMHWPIFTRSSVEIEVLQSERIFLLRMDAFMEKQRESYATKT
jgi:hypothetical protein